MDLPGLRASEGPTPEKRQLNQLKQGLGNDPRLNECGQYPMARTRSENYDGIHLGILTNAAALFSAQGYMRSSIADLAEACKLSRGALYHYFDSHEGDSVRDPGCAHPRDDSARGNRGRRRRPDADAIPERHSRDRRGQRQIAARAARADPRPLVPEQGRAAKHQESRAAIGRYRHRSPG